VSTEARTTALFCILLEAVDLLAVLTKLDAA